MDLAMLDLDFVQFLFDTLSQTLSSDPTQTLTENFLGAFTTTGDKCLDFFGTVVRNTAVTTVIQGFLEAWNEDPDKAVKLILNLRDIRGGKGEKKLALVLMYVLSCRKPLTYLANLQRFIKVGCYKDLLFISELAMRCQLASTRDFQRPPEMSFEALELKILACQLTNDDNHLQTNEKAGISLAAKWAPTENTHYDRKPLRFARRITKTLGIKKQQYRKQLTKLRSHLNVLEQLMATEKWDEISFKSLPAKAHRLYRKALAREENRKKVRSNDRVKLAARYGEYLSQLASGETSIKSTGVQPHELVLPYMNESNPEVDGTLEGQWKDMISKLRESGHFKHVTALCDVSGSMMGLPRQVAVALGLVVAELSEEPFHNQLITFHDKPTLHKITGTSLRDRVKNVMNMTGLDEDHTDLIKVFQLLLKKAKSSKKYKMVETVFVFSDMQFGQAFSDTDEKFGLPESDRSSGWETTYSHIKKLYAGTGYNVPKIVFWNLRATHKSFPVRKDDVGTALMSGFSAQMLKAFMEGTVGEFVPIAVMNDVLGKYESTPVPELERFPIRMDETDKARFQEVEAMVEKFLVAKKTSKKRRR